MHGDPLLDGSSGQHEALLNFLLGRYRQAMEDRNKQLAEEHKRSRAGDPPQIDIAGELDRLQVFINFGTEYLNKHRPVELFYPDANYGIRLDNGESFVVAPPVASVRGTMQQSSYAPITGAKYVQELDQGNSYAITGRPQPPPKGVTDMSLPTPARDQTKATAPKNYAQ